MASKKLTVNIAGKETVSPAAKKASTGLDKLNKKVTDSKKAFRTAAVGAAAAAAALAVIVKAARECEEAFFKQEKAVKLLESALWSTGQYTETASADLQNFASELQKVTTVGDEASLELMQFAISAGATADEAKEATRQAIGMSKAFGVDLNTAVRATTLAQQGNYTQLARYIPSIRSANTEAEKAAAAQKALANAFALAKDEAQTAQGIQEQLNNTWGDTKELLGEIVTERLTPFRTKLNEILTDLNAAKAGQKGFNDVWGKDGADSIKDYENALIEAQSRINSITETIDKFQTKIDNGNDAFGRNSSKLEDAQKDLRLAMADFQSIERILTAIREVDQADAAQKKKIADEAARILRYEQMIDKAVKDYGDKQQQAIDDIQKKIDTLAEYRSELRADGESEIEVQEALNLLVEERNRLLEEQKGIVEEIIYPTPADLRDALNRIDGFSEGGSSTEDKGAQVSLGGELGTIIDAIKEGGDIWVTLVNILISAIGGFEQFGEILNIVSTLLSGIGQTVIMPLLQLLQPFLALLVSIVNTIGVALYPWLQVLVMVMQLLTPIIKILADAITVVLVPVVALGAIVKWIGDVFRTLGHNIGVFAYNLEHPFKPRGYASIPGLGNAIASAVSSLRSATEKPFESLSWDNPDISDLDAVTGGSSVYGGNTSVSRVPDIYLYQTFNGPIVGDGGMEEFGRLSIMAIQDYAGVGGNVYIEG